jgi:hypothetical protein
MSDTQTIQPLDPSRLVFNQEIKDKDGKVYLYLAPIAGMKDTIAVTPTGGVGGTMFYCIKHRFAFRANNVCLDCRLG